MHDHQQNRATIDWNSADHVPALLSRLVVDTVLHQDVVGIAKDLGGHLEINAAVAFLVREFLPLVPLEPHRYT